MKKFIMATVIAACIALCAAVWPQSKVVKETPVPPPTPAVCAAEATVEKTKTTPPAEKEKEAASQTEVPQGLPHNPEPAAFEIPAAPEAQSTAESELTSKAAPKSVPEPPPEQPAAQTAVTPQTGDMVYVEGFGWIESQGPNRVKYAADMYENGNKIGSMG